MSGYGSGCRPICCPPKYCVRDFYAQRTIPVIQPVVTINRQNIVDVPQYFVQPISRNVVVNQGFQNQGMAAQGGATQGFLGRGFRGNNGLFF